jgi:hypothetical protein
LSEFWPGHQLNLSRPARPQICCDFATLCRNARPGRMSGWTRVKRIV